ncbi:MAG: SWIM zinc finger domain-containing protein, partial [Syntrophobacteraceae bacterium]
VAGNYGDYDVAIEQADGTIEASCDCPYDGYPCKHIVAVLLSFLDNRRECEAQACKIKSTNATIEDRIRKLSKEELAELVIEFSRKSPDFKQLLTVRFASDQPQTLKMLLKQVARAFPSINSDDYSTGRIAKDLDRILQAVEGAEVKMQMQVRWAVVDAILHELNEYGMDDEPLENVFFRSMGRLKDILVGKDLFASERREIIGKLMRYYDIGNCGLIDAIYDAAMELCSDEKDYQVIIKSLGPAAATDSYKCGLLAHLHGIVGDEQAELAALERCLQSGSDYWRLAKYWLRRGDRGKAMSVVLEGVEKGQGRKDELYDFLQQDCEYRGDYDGLARLLDRKLERERIWPDRLKDDPILLSLKTHYQATGDRSGILRLLEMRLKWGAVDCDLYREAEAALDKEDWVGFEKGLMSHLTQEASSGKPLWSPEVSNAASALAEIYAYKGDSKQLFETVKGRRELLFKYEDKLLPIYSTHCLQERYAEAERLIAARGRGNYREAVEHLKQVKAIYTKVQNDPAGWKNCIRGVCETNKSLRALREELAKARLIG